MPSTSATRACLGTAAMLGVCLLALAPGARTWTISALDWISGWGAWGPAVFVVVYFVATIMMLPGAVLTLGAGALFGLWGGLATVIIGSNLGATAAFVLGRTLFREWAAAMAMRSPRCAALDHATRKHGFRIVLLTRLSPLFPFNCLNYAFGLTRISLREYVAASIIGMLPGTLLFVYLGSTARNLATLDTTASAGLGGQLLFSGGVIATLVLAVYVSALCSRSEIDAATIADYEGNNPERGSMDLPE